MTARDWFSSGSIGAHGRTTLVLVDERAAFDLIELPVMEHRKEPREAPHLLTKAIEQGAVTVIFQHWIEKPKP